MRFQIDATDARLAQVWLENARGIVAAVRANRDQLPFVADGPLLDLVEVYLDIWAEVARDAEVFSWQATVEVENVEQVARQWQTIAALTDAQLAALGCAWAPEETAPFYEALLVGVTDALAQDARTRTYAEALRERPPGTE